MMEEPEFQTLEEVTTALEAEAQEWNRRGLNLNALNPGQLPPLLLDMSVKIQAITNCLIEAGVMNDDDINFQFRVIMLNNMRAMREAQPDMERQNIRKQILDAAQIRMNPNGKMPWDR